MKTGLFVVQASMEVGFGHLMECLAIAEALHGDDFAFRLVESSDKAGELVLRRGFRLAGQIPQTASFDWIFLNTRRNELSLQDALRRLTGRLIVLDELGGLKLKCHALVNFSIVKEWRSYEFDSAPELHFGPDYFPLRRSLIGLKDVEKRRRSVLVSLGGVDRTGTTFKVSEALKGVPELEVSYVFGPGSENDAGRLAGSLAGTPRHKVLVAPADFDMLLASSEFVVSAGGNTLYETSYLGGRSIVVWEDPHEKIQGEAFASAGAALVAGGGGHVDASLLKAFFMDSQPKGNAAGLKIDGCGLERIASIIGGRKE